MHFIFNSNYFLRLISFKANVSALNEQVALQLKLRERAKQKRNHNEFLRQEFETPLLPCGCIHTTLCVLYAQVVKG